MRSLEAFFGWLETNKFVEDGEISEAQLDASVKRVLTMRYNLGMFDGMGQVKADAGCISHSRQGDHWALNHGCGKVLHAVA
jgi:beta-glucosidase-like glycosyl hydrolase